MAGRVGARKLERGAREPLWMQLETDLRRRMDAGAFDDRFPGEYELVEEYGVSRHTVRDALRKMRADGVLQSTRGRGTSLQRAQIEQSLGALYSLFRSVENLGMEQRSEVRELDVREAEDVAARMGRPADTTFVYLERLRFAAGDPLALDRAWLPEAIAAPLLDADFSHTGLYDELARSTGTRLTGGSEVIRAVVPTPEQRRLLRIPPKTGALAIERSGCLDHEPVEWRETVVRGDRFSLISQWAPGQGYRMDVAGK